MTTIVHDLTAFAGQLEQLRSRAGEAEEGEASMRVAGEAASLASALTQAPPLAGEPVNGWVAVSSDDDLIATGPDFVLECSPSGMTIMSGVTTWLIAETTESDGPAAAGGQRIFVSERGELVSDWTFPRVGAPIDNLDFTDRIEQYQRELSDAIDNALQTADIDVAAPGDSATAPPTPSASTPASTPAPDDASGGGETTAIATVGGLLGSIAAREVARRLTRPRESTAEQPHDTGSPPQPWRPTHRVGTSPLAVSGVPEGTFTPGTVLDAGLEVRLIETTDDGWALVECSNTWRCYVAAWGLERV